MHHLNQYTTDNLLLRALNRNDLEALFTRPLANLQIRWENGLIGVNLSLANPMQGFGLTRAVRLGLPVDFTSLL